MGNAEYLFIAILPGQLWPRVVAPERVLSMGQIELNCVLMPNRIVWNRTVFNLIVCKQKSVLILNWIVWKGYFYMHKNGFGIKCPTMVDMP